jgi:hypothetical protein
VLDRFEVVERSVPGPVASHDGPGRERPPVEEDRPHGRTATHRRPGDSRRYLGSEGGRVRVLGVGDPLGTERQSRLRGGPTDPAFGSASDGDAGGTERVVSHPVGELSLGPLDAVGEPPCGVEERDRHLAVPPLGISSQDPDSFDRAVRRPDDPLATGRLGQEVTPARTVLSREHEGPPLAGQLTPAPALFLRVGLQIEHGGRSSRYRT